MARKAKVPAGETEQQILDAAFERFGRYGYDGVSIDQIARDCSLSKGAMYWHFKGKDALFIACLERLHGLFMRDVFNHVKAEPDPIKAVVNFFEGINRMLAEPEVQRGIAGFWVEPSRGDRERVEAERDRFEKETAEIVAAVFQRGIEQGVYRIDEDPQALSLAVMAVMETSILPLRRHSNEENKENLRILMNTFFKAYATPSASV